ncbi:hypothetical protein JCM10213_006242 [Rhodosporidiobolus nylandii]
MLDLLSPAGLTLAVLALWLATVLSRRTAPNAPPTYGPCWLPHFARGLLAVVRLGKDEDAFLRSLREYGPVVWLPWPMKQYFVTDGDAIRQVYEAPSKVLSFLPIRREMQGTVFGAPYWRDQALLDKQFFPTHAKGMSKANLSAGLERFVMYARRYLDDLGGKVDAAPSGEVVLDANDFLHEVYFEASLAAMFGPRVREASGIAKEELFEAFLAFDASFPLEASGMFPGWLLDRIPGVTEGREARETLARAFQAWIEDGFDGLDEGVVRDMAQVALDNDLGSYEAGKMICADFWALQANAPYVAVQLLIYLLQTPPTFRSALRAEADNSLSLAAESTEAEPLTFFHLAQTLPLLGSCIVETLRLGTSTFSIRDVEQPLLVRSDGEKGKPAKEVIIPPNSRLINATRCSHLDEAQWARADEWDGRRFVDEKEDLEEGGDDGERGRRSKRAREVYGFGGGISRCEGQHLATSELKSFFALFFTMFDVDLVSPANEPEVDAKFDRIKLTGVEDNAFMPKRLPNRVGMGTFQLRKESRMQIRVRRRAV